MAWTTEHITALESAIALGVRTVRYGDKETTYQSLGEMRKLLREMKVEAGVTPIMQKFYSKHNKGLY